MVVGTVRRAYSNPELLLAAIIQIDERWKAIMLPLHHQCCVILEGILGALKYVSTPLEGGDLGALGASEALGAVTLGVNAGQNGGRRGPGMERERQSTEHGRITR